MGTTADNSQPQDNGSQSAGSTAAEDREQLSRLHELTESIALQLERSRIGDYTQLLNKPLKLIGLNVLAGLAKGLGIAIGFTFFAATIIYLLQALGALNLPIIGDYIADIVRIVQRQLELS